MLEQLKDVAAQFEAEHSQHEKTKAVLAETVKKVKGNIREIKQRAMEKDALLEKLDRKRALFRQHIQRAQAQRHQHGGGSLQTTIHNHHNQQIAHSNLRHSSAPRRGHYRY